MIGDNQNTRSIPQIWKNRIISCGHNGIVCIGEYCEPDIRGNIIESNRKAGIKITEFAKAHIGGTSKEDSENLPCVKDFQNNLHNVTKGNNQLAALGIT